MKIINKYKVQHLQSITDEEVEKFIELSVRAFNIISAYNKKEDDKNLQEAQSDINKLFKGKMRSRS